MAPVMSSGHEKNQWQFICDFFINISKAKICIFRAFDWPSTISGYKLWPKNDNYLILQEFSNRFVFWSHNLLKRSCIIFSTVARFNQHPSQQ